MNFKPLFCNKFWKVYSLYNKTEKGGLVVAVQARYAAFTLVLGFHLEKMAAATSVFPAGFQTAGRTDV